MSKPQLAIAVRHLLLESKFIILGISSIIFLGLPYLKISSILYTDFIDSKRANGLLNNFTTTTGTINKIYQVKSYIPGRSGTYVLEFSYLDRVGRIKTVDKDYLATNKLGDHVLVLYNKNAAVIEHIAPYFLPYHTILTIFIISTITLLLPLIICIKILLSTLINVKRIYTLHENGASIGAEITYFKPLRHNSYIVEYLYTPINGSIKLRKKNKATNYLEVGEKKPGDIINILYDIKHPSLTCINERNYE